MFPSVVLVAIYQGCKYVRTYGSVFVASSVGFGSARFRGVVFFRISTRAGIGWSLFDAIGSQAALVVYVGRSCACTFVFIFPLGAFALPRRICCGLPVAYTRCVWLARLG